MSAVMDEAVDGSSRTRALWSSTAAFTVCFAAWTIFSILGVQVKRDLGLNDFQFGLLVGTPILTGSLIRLVLGIWADQYGGRRVFAAVMLAAAVATFLLSWAHDYPTFLLAALGVGIAGGSFSVGVAYVSKWFPKEKQGTALGIFGAGNVGAAVTKFLAPAVMVALGWQAVAQIWAAALALTAVVFFVTTRDEPDLAARRSRGAQPESFAAMMAPLPICRSGASRSTTSSSSAASSRSRSGCRATMSASTASTSSPPACWAPPIRFPVAVPRPGRHAVATGTAPAGSCTGPSSAPSSAPSCCPTRRPTTSCAASAARSPSTWRSASCPSSLLIFVLGFFMSLGKAAVYKHIPVYYPGPSARSAASSG